MTEIALRQESVLRAPAALVEWASAAKAAHELASPLVQTDFVPAHFKGNAVAATAAILYGAEAGLSPLQALQGVYVISGKPAMYARTLMAIVLAAGHEVWTEELSDSKAVVCGRRKGGSHEERVTFTMDRARKAGYTKNAKYQSDPQSMLLARAQADLCRRLAPDAILGMPSVEELEDEQPARTVTRGTAKRTVSRAVAAAPEPTEPDEPPLDDEPVAAEVVEPTPEPDTGEQMTKPQQGKIMARFKELGVEDREKRLDISRGILDLPQLISASELTKAQASALIEVICDDGVADESDLLAVAGLLEDQS